MLSNKLSNNNDNTALKPIYTTEKLGTDPSRKASGPHIFVRINYAYHVSEDGCWPFFGGGEGLGVINIYGPKPTKEHGPH